VATKVDVLIIGGGPAGSLLATAIAYRGRELSSAAAAFVDALLREIAAFERADSNEALAFWSRDARAIAGRTGHPRAGHRLVRAP
jgi:2-polyprenyl-6-methoxyphenol hydroxylase-like FAD-dependent oxidoreductase